MKEVIGFSTPHSLRKLIEWKQARRLLCPLKSGTPHSLRKLIEWKPKYIYEDKKRVLLSSLAEETN